MVAERLRGRNRVAERAPYVTRYTHHVECERYRIMSWRVAGMLANVAVARGAAGPSHAAPLSCNRMLS